MKTVRIHHCIDEKHSSHGDSGNHTLARDQVVSAVTSLPFGWHIVVVVVGFYARCTMNLFRMNLDYQWQVVGALSRQRIAVLPIIAWYINASGNGKKRCNATKSMTDSIHLWFGRSLFVRFVRRVIEKVLFKIQKCFRHRNACVECGAVELVSFLNSRNPTRALSFQLMIGWFVKARISSIQQWISLASLNVRDEREEDCVTMIAKDYHRLQKFKGPY